MQQHATLTFGLRAPRARLAGHKHGGTCSASHGAIARASTAGGTKKALAEKRDKVSATLQAHRDRKIEMKTVGACELLTAEQLNVQQAIRAVLA